MNALVSPRIRTAARTASPPYQLETMRPLVSLVFVLPLLLLYEWGRLWGTHPPHQNGFDQLLKSYLLPGVAGGFLLPVLLVGILVVVHVRRGDRWDVRPSLMPGMFLESAALGLLLFLAAKALVILFATQSAEATPTLFSVSLARVSPSEWWSDSIRFVGAGIYEELFFRLLLLGSLLAACGKWVNKSEVARIPVLLLAVLLTSLIFACAHYQPFNPHGDLFAWCGFANRMLASVFFCVVFLLRGFGIVVGTHLAYNLLTLL